MPSRLNQYDFKMDAWPNKVKGLTSCSSVKIKYRNTSKIVLVVMNRFYSFPQKKLCMEKCV